jgi:hypothetical protein
LFRLRPSPAAHGYTQVDYMQVDPTQVCPGAQSLGPEHDALHAGTNVLHAYGEQLDCTPPHPPVPSHLPLAV